LEIRLRAERRLAEMMKAQRKTVGLHEGGRPKTGFQKTRFQSQRHQPAVIAGNS